MQKILILTNSINGLYSFRRELIEELLQNSLNVTISAPNDTRTNYFKDIGCNMIETNISRRGTNPISDSKLLINYLRSIKKYKPDLAQVIRGSSHLRFDAQSKVCYHRDYWDAAEELYEKLPLIGGLMRFMKRRMA